MGFLFLRKLLFIITKITDLSGRNKMKEITERALYYGDSLFETIRIFNSRIPFLNKHLERLFAGMDAIRFIKPKHWNFNFFEEEILKISPSNARVRLTVWRKSGGKFLPENNEVHIQIDVFELTHSEFSHQNNFIKIEKSQRVMLVCDHFSNLKTLNAPRYVAAAIEAKERNLDDVILPNMYGRVGECSSSNIFMVKKNKLITPSLSEGCVAGTMRETVIELAMKSSFVVIEKPITFAALKTADEIFMTNSIRGIVGVGECCGLVYERHDFSKKMVDLLNEKLTSIAK
jgi:branched-chain amino acid aminotransferase